MNGDLYIIKYDSNGLQKWIKTLDSGAAESGRDITIDNSNFIYVSGNTNGSFDKFSIEGLSDSLVAKYDSEGNQIWIKQFGTEGSDGINILSMDSANNFYIAGSTTGAIDNHTNAGGSDGVIMKMNSDGEFISGGSGSGSGGSNSSAGGGATERITGGAVHTCAIKADDSLQC